ALLNNEIRDFGIFGINLRNGTDGVVSGNQVGDGFWSAFSINLDRVAFSLLVSDNRFFGNRFGIYCTNASPLIVGNLIDDTARGITVFGNSSPLIVDGNQLVNNERAIELLGTGNGGPSPVIVGNSFQNSTNEHIFADNYADGSPETIIATGNWWGSIALGDIVASIRDFTEADDAPVIDFSGFLSEPGGAPVDANLVVGGTLDGDFEWDAAEPYDVVGRLVVPAGASAEIPAGTELRFYERTAGIDAEGSLLVLGVAGNPVRLTSGLPEPSGSDWNGITVHQQASDVIIREAQFSYAHAAVLVTGIGASAEISSNSIQGAGLYGIRVEDRAEADVLNNSVAAPLPSSGVAVGISFQEADGLVQGNVTQNMDVGISLSDSSPDVIGNLSRSNRVGIEVFSKSSPQITGDNQVIANLIGIEVKGDSTPNNNPSPITNGNSIFGNGANFVATNSFFDGNNVVLDATGNWWGSTNPDVIADGIIDSNDGLGSNTPTVDFSGFLGSR
ncbi:MAG: right-handed parallel beta-helix repeat-containing protein, partial [Pseudomonadota bacterium]